MPPEDPALVATLLALAGARRGDAVAEVGADPRVRRALLAMSGTPAAAARDARVVVAGSPADLPLAVALLAPGGRLVSLARDEATARSDARAAGVTDLHLVPVGDAVAWSGRSPTG